MLTDFFIETSVVFGSFQPISHLRQQGPCLFHLNKAEEYGLLLSRSNTLSFWLDDQCLLLEPKSIYLLEPGEMLRVEARAEDVGDVSLLTFAYHPIQREAPPRKTPISLPRRAGIDHPQFYDMLTAVEEEIAYDVYQYKPRLDILLAQLLLVLCRYCKHQDLEQISSTSYYYTSAHVKRIIDYLECNYQKDIASMDIEKHIGLNYDYANTLFKQTVGITIMKYLSTLRIKAAKDMLLHTNLPVSEIAGRVGVFNPPYFTKKFNTVVGMSPSQYRQCGHP